MADLVDVAGDMEEVSKESAVRKIRQAAAAQPALTGKCRYCDDEVDGRPFCDPNCRDDWEKQQKIKLINNKG